MIFFEIMKAIILGIVEGFTEWLPISSTGHMILVDEFLKLNNSAAFKEMFLVVIQLGAIIAVVVLFFNTLNPFTLKKKRLSRQKVIVGGPAIKKETLSLWLKILVACVPAAIIGYIFNNQINSLFYNYQTVAVTLVIYGIIFLIVESRTKIVATIRDVAQIDYKTALVIGAFQLLALIPGTSRSGATILGAILLGASRPAAAEFSFVLAVPVMFGASLVKLAQFGLHFSGDELAVLLTGMAVAFVVSIFAIRFLMGFIRKHDFKPFGWYRIILGAIVILYFISTGN